jgi:hypothetical protein
MTDLTDSFCERCGARYAFVANASKGPLKGARVLARGLKNFVLTDGQSLGDAMGLARLEGDHEVSSRVAEAFHRTFNFCMSCRQYACDRCWNEAAGECLSCAPAPEGEVVATGRRRTPARPAVAEELPILQAATGESEPDWSLFPEAPVPDASARWAGVVSSAESSAPSGRRPEPAPQDRAPLAWPAAGRPGGRRRLAGCRLACA